jgi:hypothetical protein
METNLIVCGQNGQNRLNPHNLVIEVKLNGEFT